MLEATVCTGYHAFDCTALSRYVECPCGVFGLFSLYRLQICIRLRVRACSTRGRCGCPRPRMLLQPGRRVPCGVWDRCGPVGIGISCWRSLRRSAHVAVEHWTTYKAPYASIVASVKEIIYYQIMFFHRHSDSHSYLDNNYN